MSVVVNRKRSLSLESTDVERQQQILFDLSVMKLHHEQGRQGMEPRLLRFVLINNALRALQSHMMQIDDDDGLIFDDDGHIHGGFVGNTFKHGGLTSQPVSPPTPVKMLKLDSSFGEQSPQSPLVASSPAQVVCCREEDGKERDQGGGSEERGGGGGGEKKALNSLALVNQSCGGVHLGKRQTSEGGTREAEEEEVPGGVKRPCRTHVNGAKLNGTTALHSVLEAASGDFAKVDPTLYDYDTHLPGAATSGSSSSSSAESAAAKPSGCAMEAIVYQNGDSGRCSNHVGLGVAPEAEAGVCDSGGHSAPEGGGEGDFLEDIDHIVSLLMT